LHGPDSFVSRGQFPFQTDVTRRFLRQNIQILQRAVNNEFPRRRRAWQILDGVMNIEDQRIGEASDVAETALCEARLPDRDDQSDNQDQGDRRSRRYSCLVSGDEFRCAVTGGIPARDYGKVRQVSPNVSRELFH
jgi:hypothetical protein